MAQMGLTSVAVSVRSSAGFCYDLGVGRGAAAPQRGPLLLYLTGAFCAARRLCLSDKDVVLLYIGASLITYRITLLIPHPGDKIAHTPVRISDPVSSKTWGGHSNEQNARSALCTARAAFGHTSILRTFWTLRSSTVIVIVCPSGGWVWGRGNV